MIGGRIHSLFKAVEGSSLQDWVALSLKQSDKGEISAIFKALGQTLAEFHLRHRASAINGLSTLSRAVHHDLNFKNVFYDEKSGFSLIDTIGLSVSILEPSEVRHDLKRLFEDMEKSGMNRSVFIKAYVHQWPEAVQESLQSEIEALH